MITTYIPKNNNKSLVREKQYWGFFSELSSFNFYVGFFEDFVKTLSSSVEVLQLICSGFLLGLALVFLNLTF